MIDGLPQLQAQLKRIRRKYEKGYSVGLKRAGLFVQRKSQEIVPIEFGILKNSARTEADGSRFDTKVSVMYLASYAVYVHENTRARHAPGKTAKFLTKPLEEHSRNGNILRIVKEAMEI